MIKRKVVYKLCILFLITCSLTGCWDREELENSAYVIGLGLDRSENENKIKITLLIANPEVGSQQGGGGSTEEAREIISFDANDFLSAKSTANAIISRDVSYELLKIIVISEEFAKDEKFIPTINDTLRDKEIRLDTYLAVSKENASEYFLENKPKMETRPHKFFQYMVHHGIDNGLIPDSTLFRFFRTLDRGTDLFLAMYTTTKREKEPKVKSEDAYIAGELNASGELDDTQFLGSAVIKEGIMIDTLTGMETRLVNILDETTDIKDIIVDLPDPFSDKQNKEISIRILKPEENKVKMNIKGERLKIDINIPLQIEIMTNPSMVDLMKNKNQQILKKDLTERFETLYQEFIKKTQTELKGSTYPLSIYARKHFRTIPEFQKFDWVKSYPQADVSVNVDIDIVDYNAQRKRPERIEG